MKNYLFSGLLIVSLLFAAPVGAAVVCETKLGTLQSGEFKTWINTIQTEGCAKSTLDTYPEIEPVEPGDDVVAAANAYHTAMAAFYSVLANSSFDPVIVDKVNEIKPAAASKVDQFDNKLFSLSVPTERSSTEIRGTLQIGGGNVDRYASYVDHCVDSPDVEACARWEKSVRLLGAMKYLTSVYSQPINREMLAQFADKLDQYINEWDNYFEQRKPQLPWEILANEAWNRDLRTAPYFTHPPKGDLVVLHPALVYSYIGDAQDGEEQEPALAIELIGYNQWERSNLSGVSLVAINTDRADIDDTGYGVMLHFRNHYSLGWTKNGDDEGWFFSIDLLNAVDDKRKKINAKKAEIIEQFDLLKNKIEGQQN